MIAFGPISSRRLGKSLGINNIVSHKVCSYSCVYCQIGTTKNKSVTRESFNNPEKLAKEVEAHIKKLDINHKPDYLTFVANGEPTLDINLGREIKLLRKFGFPIAVITNSSIIHLKDLQDDLMEADWISVKVDSTDSNIWQKVNRPAAGIDFEKILEGLQTFALVYKGKLFTETMLVNGFNDSARLLERNATFISKLKPQKAYLSVPIRPPAIKGIKPASEDILLQGWQIYQNAGLVTELLTGFEGTDTGTTGNVFEDILNITAVHPLHEDSVRRLLEQNKADNSVIELLVSQGLITGTKYKGKIYYVRNYHY